MEQTKSTIHILLADMHHIVRSGIRQEIDKQADMIVVGETANGYEALDLAAELKLDVVVLDVKLAGLNGIYVTRCLTKMTRNTSDKPNPVPAILIFSAYNDKQYVWSSLAAGASGYLLKSERMERLPAAIRKVAAGQTVLSQTVQTSMVAVIPSLNQELSASELKVIQLLAHGLSNQDIARKLHISEGTVKSHLNNTYRKIPWIRTRAEAVAWAWINHIPSESE